jgi:bacillithiol biosynthesis deacetylase BshB1
MACDLLVFAPHPDDAEIHCGATIAAQVRQGARVIVVDATRGEMGSRGTVAERDAEAEAAAAVLGVHERHNLGLPDGGLMAGDRVQRDALVEALRRHAPRTVLTIGGDARHGDHLALHALSLGAVKMAALHRFPSAFPAVPGIRLWCYEAELPLAAPMFIVPASEADWERKRAAVACYGSQLAGRDGAPTTIATPEFTRWMEARGRTWGFQAGAAYGEAFYGPEAARVADLRLI